MCLDKFPVEFDAEGNARLSDSVEDGGGELLEDVTVPDDELGPEERFGAIVEELPDRAVQRIEASESDTARTGDADSSSVRTS
jgi:hypothetical protein